jgi:hypothetical protein
VCHLQALAKLAVIKQFAKFADEFIIAVSAFSSEIFDHRQNTIIEILVQSWAHIRCRYVRVLHFPKNGPKKLQLRPLSESQSNDNMKDNADRISLSNIVPSLEIVSTKVIDTLLAMKLAFRRSAKSSTDGVCFAPRTASGIEIFRIKFILPAFLERDHLVAAAKNETDQDGAVFLKKARKALGTHNSELFQVTIRDQDETL